MYQSPSPFMGEGWVEGFFLKPKTGSFGSPSFFVKTKTVLKILAPGHTGLLPVSAQTKPSRVELAPVSPKSAPGGAMIAPVFLSAAPGGISFARVPKRCARIPMLAAFRVVGWVRRVLAEF